MSRGRFFTRRSTSDSVRVGALSLSVAVHLAALTVLGAQAEPQIRLTVRHLLEAGATEREIAEVIWQMSMFGGLPAMQKALEIAQSAIAETKEKDA